MPYDIGPKIGIDGEAEFRQQLKDINNGLKTLGSEMTVVTSAFLRQEKSVQALSAQNDVLNRSLYSLNDRLELQEKMLKASANAYGENDERTQKWQQALNQTQAEINKTNAQIASNTQLMGELGDTATETAEKEAKAADKSAAASEKRGDALKKLSKIALAAVAATTAAVGALMKTSLEGYGEFEQLTGGVETLFGKSADAVKRYANDAYKTAGLTANQYMETVTGFSASLISSLGGNTAWAAELANQAIVDMSDNANKMGSDITSIQNAYQGFAKGQFNMLDNLKLGYGGTKTEMERLLADAEKLTGIHYNIDNFADITQAIHAIQTQMGITGTTAKEASTTIQGSVASMGAAWQNLVVGMADDNADLDQLITNFVDSVKTAGENVIPRLEQILTGFGQVVQQLAPILAQELPGLIQAVLPSMLEAGATLVLALVSGLTQSLPALVQAGAEALQTVATALMEIVPEIFTAIGEALPDLIPTIVGAMLDIIDTIVGNTDLLVDGAVSLIQGLTQGVLNALPVLLEKAPVIISSLIEALVACIPQLLEAAGELIGGLAKGIVQNIPAIVVAVAQVVGALLMGIGEAVAGVFEAGASLAEGFWEGLVSKIEWLKEKVKGFFSGIVDGVKDLLGIHSPSRVFAGIGDNMAAGLGEGWDKAFPGIQKDIEKSLTFNAMGAGDWARQIAGNMEMDLTGPTYAGRVAASSAAAAEANPQGAGNLTGDIVINVTETIDGQVLAHNQHKYNLREAMLAGTPMTEEG